MSPTIIDKITEQAPLLTQDGAIQLVPELVDFYSGKISYLAGVAYSKNSQLAIAAFKEWSTSELAKGLNTFIFTSQHWRTGRDLNSYLLTCLNRLADKIKLDVSGQKKISVPLCPACKEFGAREYLSYSDKHLRCNSCEKEVVRLESDKNSGVISEVDVNRLRLHSIFALHSRRGWRCPDCERFIPDSYLQQYGVSCPYDDCGWFGTKNELASMAHPLGLSSQYSIPINLGDTVKSGSQPAKMAYFKQDAGRGSAHVGTTVILENFDCPKDSLDQADINIEFVEKYENEFKVLCDVINLQIDSIKRTEIGRCHQKLMMYQAYKNLIQSCPEDMISYLVHLKHVSGSPIQARIFQEYVRLLENSLPFEIVRGNKTFEICSLMDPNMKLFWGISEFDAVVQNNGTIPNNTKEVYIGGRKLKNFGPCFIGLLIDVVDASKTSDRLEKAVASYITKETIIQPNNSLMSHVKNYTFVHINVADLEPGLPVKVKHFRIASHYEMGPLVILQRVRRRIVDAVYFKLNGKKRLVGKEEDD